MSYTPTTWANGDTIDATKLNKMEQGIAGATPMVVECSSTTPYTLDHTYAEIFNALRAGTPVYIHILRNATSDWDSQYDTYAAVTPVIRAFKYIDMYRVYASWNAGGTAPTSTYNVGIPAVLTFQVANINDYPTFLRRAEVDTSSIIYSTNIV